MLGRSLYSVARSLFACCLPSARLAEARPQRSRTPAPPGQPVGVARDVEAEPKIVRYMANFLTRIAAIQATVCAAHAATFTVQFDVHVQGGDGSFQVEVDESW